MEWYYAAGDKQMGPVAEDEFKKLTADGTIRPDTLVWHAGLDGWKPLRDVKTPASPGVATPPGPGIARVSTSNNTVVCRECGKLFKADEVVMVNDAPVCHECAPAFQERSGTGNGQPTADLTEEELIHTDYEVDISESLSASWNLFQRTMGIVIGATVLVYIALFAVNLIPYLSIIIAPLLSGPLMGGLWYFYIQNNRGNEVTVGDAFSGFGQHFWQLVLANIVTSIATMLCMIPVIITAVVMFGAAFVSSLYQGQFESVPTEFGIAGVVALIVTGLFGFIGSIVVTITWIYGLALVIDKGLPFWSALELSRKMVFKRFWGTLLLGFVCWLLMAVGAMMCLVGLLFTGPIAFGAIVWQYERIYGRLRPES